MRSNKLKNVKITTQMSEIIRLLVTPNDLVSCKENVPYCQK